MTQKEIWRPVKGYEGLYEVSSLGKVRSYQNYGGGLRETPKILKASLDKYGYLGLTLCKEAVHKRKTVHRLVAEAFVDTDDYSLTIDHKNGIKMDNRADNLEWVTSKENTLRSAALGLKPTGERHGNHKLTWEKVAEIRQLYKECGISHAKLAVRFGVSRPVVTSVINNKTWRHRNEPA